jgi:small-conductance mechanosensitive channel
MNALVMGRRRFLTRLLSYRDILVMTVSLLFVALALADVSRTTTRMVANIALFTRLAWTSHLAKLVTIVFSRVLPVMLYLVYICSRTLSLLIRSVCLHCHSNVYVFGCRNAVVWEQPSQRPDSGSVLPVRLWNGIRNVRMCLCDQLPGQRVVTFDCNCSLCSYP